ncbi:MAG TPA: DNA-binding protein YbiB [Burkholderiaceae bacterium]|nr:DNA-binding protein YbiB [Burkholderiaceae bacterium]
MAIAHYLREIGRGAKGARSLGVEAAQDLMGQVLDGALSDLEVGAFVIAMRMKGESLDELVGFVQALHERLQPLHTERPVIAIASYNGARRLPNLVALLALLLARAGARVLVHGPALDPQRVTSAEVFAALGMAPAMSADAVARDWRERGCAFAPTALLSPALERLLAVRRTVGLRNSGHTIAKLMSPVQGAACLRLMSHTHPEFGQLMAAYAERTHGHVGLLRGTEGEAVADPRREPRQRIWIAGQLQNDLAGDTELGTLTAPPQLPAAIDAATTARWIEAVLTGQVAAPRPLSQQVERLMQAFGRMPGAQQRTAAQLHDGQADSG